MSRVCFWVLVGAIVIYTIFPLYWALVSSLKPGDELFSTPARYAPSHIYWGNYAAVLTNANFLKAIRNSVVTAAATVLIALVLGAICAYAIGRLRFRGRCQYAAESAPVIRGETTPALRGQTAPPAGR